MLRKLKHRLTKAQIILLTILTGIICFYSSYISIMIFITRMNYSYEIVIFVILSAISVLSFIVIYDNIKNHYLSTKNSNQS